MEININDHDLSTWAGYLLDHSLGGIRADDIVMIKGEHITWPLISVLQEKIISAGAIADIYLVPPDNDRGKVWGAAMARHGNLEQINRVPEWLIKRYESMTKYIEVLGSENPALFADLPADTSQEIMRADEPFKLIRMFKPWVLTLFPTPGFAAMEGMDLQAYVKFIVGASTVDPRQLDAVEEPLYQLMKKSRQIRIQTVHPANGRALELKMSIAGRTVIKCTGEKNFPDGEVFTSPDATSVEGEIYVDLPVSYNGVTIQGIYLNFSDGMIREYNAVQGENTLRTIIETDKGSHRLGEVALGMNQGIQKVLKHPLFVEKVGGTLHIAIGASYPECFVDDPTSEEGKKETEDYIKRGLLNRSAQHVDIVTDFRSGGAGKAVFLDDIQLQMNDNIWTVPE
jgi:aminopeptidase